jgi:hypothetical protein
MRTLLVRQGATKSRRRTLPRSGNGPEGVRSVATNNPSLSANSLQCLSSPLNETVQPRKCPRLRAFSV